MNTEVFAYNSIKNRHEILTKSLYAVIPQWQCEWRCPLTMKQCIPSPFPIATHTRLIPLH